ncbi:hypothetical protein GLAREA_04343 [Glarea lozoyensis ATCC 20868]|uniref:Uncharacterized protein n=1 Tax=Glarea lozoyensis (strain ATCC 20868 / MF5171) TaxID=1116229 RepID=S3CM16_GLAL2|nr:uncharacterized protein GLAREA_04343 [Glarea lozoyensis ATCC 20868]EPE27552.1 hypothetical protein GLAREA_04343 [Glarea lozoyensis ATCC 20868]
MHLPTFSLAIFTVATLISAGPIEPLPGTTPEKADGFYASRFEDDGSATLMEFIPLTDTMNNTTSSTILDTRTIEARSSAVTCENAILNRNDLISAWNCLIWTMTPSKTMEKNYVYHCKSASVVAYACSYSKNTLNPVIIQTTLTTVSNTCGGVQAGYQRCKKDCGVTDMTIGRNYNGAAFCFKDFYGS